MISIKPNNPVLLRRGELHVKMELLPGQGAALIGPNGIGKTSFIKYLKLNTRTLFPEKKVAFLDQGALCPLGPLSTFDLLETVSAFSGRAPIPATERNALIHNFDFSDKMHQPIRHLSGGENQAAKILATFLFDADVFILDEPASHLDTRKIAILITQLKHILSQNKYLLFIDHKKNFISAIGETCWQMEERDRILQIEHTVKKNELDDLLTSFAEAGDGY